MKPYYEQDGITIYHGDCREVLPTLEAGSVGQVITSPPYNVGLKYETYDDKRREREFRELNLCWLKEAARLGEDSCRLYAVVSDAMMWWMRKAGNRAGFKFTQLLVWCKPNLAGGKKIGKDWAQMTEWVMQFRKGKRTPMLSATGATTHNYFVIPSPQRNWNEEKKQHVAQFPINLPRRIIARTPGGLVLDPFIGSGSTLMAARLEGRKAIGVEMDERYCEIAAKRLAQGVLFRAGGAA